MRTRAVAASRWAAAAIDLSQAPIAFLGAIAGVFVAVLAGDTALRLTADVVAAGCAARFSLILRSVTFAD